MPTARSILVDDEIPLHYHLVSRCVRRSWLCGRDPYTKKCYDYRRDWIKQRLYHLARSFAIEVTAYSIMSDHFHIAVYFDPLESQRWDESEVADRWLAAFPPKSVLKKEFAEVVALHKEILLENPKRINHARQTLGSMSKFMQYLKQPIARRANVEDACTGHFFEGRFYSGALLNEDAIVAAMAYVDLNEIRAEIVDSIEQISDASIHDRLATAIAPLVSGITCVESKETGASNRIAITLDHYCERLVSLALEYRMDIRTQDRSGSASCAIGKRQRAYGSDDALDGWAKVTVGAAKQRDCPDHRPHPSASPADPHSATLCALTVPIHLVEIN